jgi:Flp pilus assembly CpaF family ATPase
MPFAAEQIKRLTEQLTVACNPLLDALRLPDIEDIALNPDGMLWQNTRAAGWTPFATMDEDEAFEVVTSVAAMKHRPLNETHPVLETIFPLDGSRFEAVIPPVTRKPVFAIRVKSAGRLRLSDYEAQGVLTDSLDPLNTATSTERFITRVKGLSHGDVLRHAVKAKQSAVYVGPTGSGKTTLSDAFLTEIGLAAPRERAIYIEDTPELVCDIPNSVDLLACEDVGIDMLRCVRIAMRLRPKRIIVGEVRGPEAHALLKAWNTGHPGGIATVHADDAYSGLLRMESLVAESTSAPQQDLIAQAIHLVVFIEEEPRVAAGRKVREIIAVTGYDRARGRYEFVSL